MNAVLRAERSIGASPHAQALRAIPRSRTKREQSEDNAAYHYARTFQRLHGRKPTRAEWDHYWGDPRPEVEVPEPDPVPCEACDVIGGHLPDCLIRGGWS